MARAGVVLGEYFAVVRRFLQPLGESPDLARLCGLGRAVLGGDGSELLSFLHTTRCCLTAHRAPEEVWEWHEAALAVVIDLAAEGATFERLDEEFHRDLVDAYEVCWSSGARDRGRRSRGGGREAL
ncbi:hypothetical protein [Streptoalloteichus hindustanus]|uniref:hypothetical protein n=1 Tax=Streptoalloteichus hindustanus TaxID=2017 RepID=UPI001160F30E|nr:hypothetical protein [Streptoalloteichus hindustanus]